MTQPEFLLEIEGVSKTYLRGTEDVHALRSASLSLRSHEFVALVGPSGSGKSTLLNVLAGWEAPDEGEIHWQGGSVATPLADLPWSDVAILPQSLGLVEDLTVRENTQLPVRLSGLDGPHEERAEKLLRGLGLDVLADREPAEISMGEQQRAALARALVLSPRLLLADEPTGHQDADWARGVFRAIRFAAKEGTACLVATHHQEAVQFADRVLAIRDGQVRELIRGEEGLLTAE
jgi:putative ABC transport system ATP-binding protein